MDLNKVMLMGRSTATPQLKKIDSLNISVVNFTLATNRRYKNKDGNLLEDTEYHKCVAYEKQADLLATYLTKGKKLYVEGKLRTKKWQDSQGQDRFTTEIVVDSFIFLDKRSDSTGEPMDFDSSEDVPF
jgi:single-strand binding protein